MKYYFSQQKPYLTWAKVHNQHLKDCVSAIRPSPPAVECDNEEGPIVEPYPPPLSSPRNSKSPPPKSNSEVECSKEIIPAPKIVEPPNLKNNPSALCKPKPSPKPTDFEKYPFTRHSSDRRKVIFVLGSTWTGKTSFVQYLANLLNYDTVEDSEFYNHHNEIFGKVQSPSRPHVYDFLPREHPKGLTFTLVDICDYDPEPDFTKPPEYFTSVLFSNFDEIHGIFFVLPLTTCTPLEMMFTLNRYLAVIPRHFLSNIFFFDASLEEGVYFVRPLSYLHSLIKTGFENPGKVVDPEKVIELMADDYMKFFFARNYVHAEWFSQKLILLNALSFVAKMYPMSSAEFYILARAQVVLKPFLEKYDSIREGYSMPKTVDHFFDVLKKKIPDIDEDVLKTVLTATSQYIHHNECNTIYFLTTTLAPLPNGKKLLIRAFIQYLLQWLQKNPLSDVECTPILGAEFASYLDNFINRYLTDSDRAKMCFKYDVKFTTLVPINTDIK